MIPIKTRMLELAIEWEKPFTAKEMAEVLKKEYNGERTTDVKEVDKQLEMYVRVDMLKSTNVEIDENDELVVWYQITDIGKEGAKYIPAH